MIPRKSTMKRLTADPVMIWTGDVGLVYGSDKLPLWTLTRAREVKQWWLEVYIFFSKLPEVSVMLLEKYSH